jgi:hypothetical protein
MFQTFRNVSFGSLFLTIVDHHLLQDILSRLPPNALLIRRSPPYVFKPSLKHLYLTLAISIRIIGLQNRPLKNRPHHRPLREAIKEALSHFSEIKPEAKSLGITLLEKLVSLPLFTAPIYEHLSLNFQKLVYQLGDSVAGDEKLFHFTGNSGDVRLVPNKPARIGLWFYQLCVQLPDGSSFLLWTRLHHSNGLLGESMPTTTIIEAWADVVKRLGNADTLLTMDSYYLTADGKDILHRMGVKYLAAVTSVRFKSFHDYLSSKVTVQGQWAAIHNPTTSVTVLYNWSSNESIGKKMIMSNAFKITPSPQVNYNIPLFEHYKQSFRACDRFNEKLHDRSWPHRKGGFCKLGDLGTQHNYMLSSILQNTFNCYRNCAGRRVENQSFQDCCERLSDEIFMYSSSLP